jgi:hypothetical protein
VLVTSAIVLTAELLLEFFKNTRKPWQLEADFRQFVDTANGFDSIPADIRNYLLSVITADKNDDAKFNNHQLAEAQRILDRAGPGAFYWMSEIATQLAFLAAAQINGIPTNVGEKLGACATPEEVVGMIVKL